MSQANRQKRRKQRQRQRNRRQQLNAKLKRQGKGWVERRRIIRRRRKADRSQRKAAFHNRKAGERNLALKRQHRAGFKRRSGGAPLPPGAGAPPPPLAPALSATGPSVLDMVNTSTSAARAPGSLPLRPWRRPVVPRRPMPRVHQSVPMAPLVPAAARRAAMPALPATAMPYGNPYAAAPYPVDPFAMDPFAADPYAMDPFAMDPYAMAPFAVDPYTADPYGLVDPSDDDAILIDVDNVDYVSTASQDPLWSEFAGDVADIAGEIAGELAGASVSGIIGEDEALGSGLIDLEALVEKIGRRRIRELHVVATIDAWPQEAYERDARAIVEAVNEVQDAIEEADQVSGALVGGAGLVAALTAIPGLAAIVPKVLDAKQNREDRRSNRRRRRRQRASDRADARQDLLDELKDAADRHRAGLLDTGSGEWGGASRAGDVIVRAKAGKRAALATLPGGFYLVREVDEGVSTADIQAAMTAAAQAASAAIADADIAGCGCQNRTPFRR